MTDTIRRKTQLRSTLRQRRKSLSPTEQHTAAQVLVNSVADLLAWKDAQRIALYLAADGEIDTRPLENMARSLGKQVYLPVIADDDSLCFALWNTADPLSKNRYSIPEPPTKATRCPVSDLDIIFLPLVGWDLLGGRLGMGGGFYDRTLAGISGPLLVGLAHNSQRVEKIPQDSWDLTLDFIATDAALYRCQGE